MISDFPFGLEVETRVHARPETVFAFFSDPELYRRWQGQSAELDPRPGGRYRVQMPGRTTVEGSYLVIDPPRRLVFTWGWVGNLTVPPGSTTVEVTFTPDGEDTVVHLAHLGLPSESSRDEHGLGWRHYLDRLSVAAAGKDPGPDPSAVTRALDQDMPAADELRR